MYNEFCLLKLEISKQCCRFERALQTINPSVTLPYFDSNLDYHLGDDLATQTVTWTADFAGNGDGQVTTGPFADWPLPFPINNRRFLFRNLTFAPDARTAPALMSDQALNTILNARRLRNICWNVDSSFETFHGATHNWVGGVMVNLPVSPSDPMFFLHHSFIDCLFTLMRNNQRTSGINVDFDYPNDTVAMGVGMRRQGDRRLIGTPQDSWHYSLAEMRPFGPLRNIDGLSSFYDDIIHCAPRPTCSGSDTSCGGSEYLFCDESTYRCAPKLRLGASCERFSRYSPCFTGLCCNGICRRNCGVAEPGPRREPERSNEVPDTSSDARPSPPTADERTPPMVETMHGVTEVRNERPDPDAFQPNEPRNSIDMPEPEHPRRGTEPEIPTHESRPETRPANTDRDVHAPEELPQQPPRDNTPNENTHREQRPDDSSPVDHRPDVPSSSGNILNENSSGRQTSRHGIFLNGVHPGVPTHAPYVIPTLPPVPTHLPYIVPQVPTHPPGYDIIPPAPTHPPSVFEHDRHVVKRDHSSSNRYEHHRQHRNFEPRPYTRGEKYEHEKHSKSESKFDNRREPHKD